MPTLTNKYGLPEPLVNAVARETYVREGDISVTELIQPPQMRYLMRKHRDELTEDASDGIYRLLGSAVHEVLRRAGDDNALHEERLAMRVNGLTVTGMTDRYQHDSVIRDFKMTSVYSFLLGDKADWEAQLNAYATLWRLHGWPVERLEIVAILRDWTRRRSLTEPDYPPAPALVKEIPLWPHEKCVAYIRGRVALHQAAERGDGFPPCTDEERWARGEKWAVKKKRAKRAQRLFDMKETADLWAEAQNRTTGKEEFEVEHRPADSIRCAQGYCLVARWCEQARAMGIVPNEDGQD